MLSNKDCVAKLMDFMLFFLMLAACIGIIATACTAIYYMANPLEPIVYEISACPQPPPD